MERKGNWFSSVKKAFSPESKETKHQKSKKYKNKWFGKEKSAVPDSSPSETVEVTHPLPPPPPHPLPPPEEVKLTEVENEQTKHPYYATIGTATAAETAVAADESAAEIVRLTGVTQFSGKSKEEVAAIKIQTAFRGYIARRSSRALRGFVRLKSLVQALPVKRQTANALRCMQALARAQSQIQSRRIRMSEENQALQRQLLQKRAREFESLRIGVEWDDSLQSKEQIEAKLLGKFEAAMRREKALAYSFSHQKTWKKSTRSAALMFMVPNNPQWGWSWLERWMAGRPWEAQSVTVKELNNDQSSTKSDGISSAGGEITKSYARHQLNSAKLSPTSSPKPNRSSSHQFPPTPPLAARKMKPESPRGSMLSPESPRDDAKRVFSVSEGNRRHSIAGPSVRDDESLGSSPAVRSYMAPTQSAKAKSRMQSPLGLENGTTPDKNSAAASARKRLSFPASPARPRRHSGPSRTFSSVPGMEGAVNCFFIKEHIRQ